MDIDDDLIRINISPTRDEPSSKNSESSPQIQNSTKIRKVVPSENKGKSKSKKGSSCKSWSASASGTGLHQVDASAFSFHRMRTLMKTQASVQNITHDATFLVAKATELFIRDIAYRMAEEALTSNGVNGSRQSNGSGDHGLVANYDHLAEIVHTNKQFLFLREFVPRKVLAGQVLPDAFRNSSRPDGSDVIDLASDSS